MVAHSAIFTCNDIMNSDNTNLVTPKHFEWLGGLLQTTDTLFPSGGYAQSYGLEEMVALGRVKSKEDLEDFLMQEILPSLEKLDVFFGMI